MTNPLETVPVTSAPVITSEAAQPEFDRALPQHSNDLGTIDLDKFFLITPFEEKIRATLNKVQRQGIRGVLGSMVVHSSKLKIIATPPANEVVEGARLLLPVPVEGVIRHIRSSVLGRLSMRGSRVATTDEPDAPLAPPSMDFNDVLRSPALFELYVGRYESLLKESNRQRQTIAQDTAYQESLAYWERRINAATDQCEQAECTVIRDRILRGVYSRRQIHELAMKDAEQYYRQGLPLDRLDDLADTDALTKGHKLPDVPIGASITPQYPYFNRYRGTGIPQSRTENCSFYRPHGARASINFGAGSQESYKPGGTAALSDYGTTILNDYQQAPSPSTSVLEPVVTRRLPYLFDETCQL